MICIIGAMDVEINSVKSRIENPVAAKIAGVDFVCGEINGCTVCAAQCGPGKINAALCAQIMADRFDADEIINIGVGCSLSPDVAIKNIVVASDVCQYDIDITALGEPRGYINGLNTIKIPTNHAISEKLSQIAIASGERIHRGTVASGDTFYCLSRIKSRNCFRLRRNLRRNGGRRNRPGCRRKQNSVRRASLRQRRGRRFRRHGLSHL